MKGYLTWAYKSIWKNDDGSEELDKKYGPVFLDKKECKLWRRERDDFYFIEEVNVVDKFNRRNRCCLQCKHYQEGDSAAGFTNHCNKHSELYFGFNNNMASIISCFDFEIDDKNEEYNFDSV